jgi:2,4-dienoyl-CoA reductase-like NADH-dependent reductase (Old Yellow Enzyme family)/thioredoxin reductase
MENEMSMTKRPESPFVDLFTPIQVASLQLRNRIVMPSMSTNFALPESPGFVSERHIAYYRERARGGAGLIMIQATGSCFSPASRRLGLLLHKDAFISGLAKLVQAIKDEGAASGIQIAPLGVGRIGALKMDATGHLKGSSLGHDDYFAVSPLPHPITGKIPKELSTKQLNEISEQMAEAGKRARKAGFDVVEIHGAHGYLLHEFLSPRTNRRMDLYGGELEGRARFPLEVVSKMREAVGDKVVLSYRLSGTEFVEGGLDIDDVVAFAGMLEKTGIQIIHVSGGTNETPRGMNRVIPPMSYPSGRLVPYAARIKKSVSLPVIVVQRINTPELANGVLREGKADLVATGRALIADPYWPLKALEGRTEEIRKCVACNQGCMEQIVFGNTLTCLYNPEVGWEHLSVARRKTEKSKRVLVIGGGPAGMEAASVLAEKGHTVHLAEKEKHLGGAIRLGSTNNSKKELSSVVEYLRKQLKKLKVEVQLGKRIDPKSFSGDPEMGPYDEIIVATGSKPMIPIPRPEASSYRFFTASEILGDSQDVGHNVLVIGGGSTGIEVAEYLCDLRKDVTVIEMNDRICADLGPLNRAEVLERLERLPIRILLNTTVLAMDKDGLRVSKAGKEEYLRVTDTVVVAMGVRPSPLTLVGASVPVHYIGDCRKVGNAMDAIHEAFKIANSL